MYRIAQVSDIHLTSRLRWFEDYVCVLDNIKDDIETRQVDLIVVTGDLSGRDAPHRMTEPERHVLARWFRALSRNRPVVVIRGNHDAKQELLLFETCYPGHHPIHVSEDYGIYELDPISVCCLPWRNKSDLVTPKHSTNEAANEAVLAQLSLMRRTAGKWPVLIGHIGVVGANLTETVVQTANDVAVPRSALLEWPAVLLGHLHIPQEFYPGSPVPLDVSESKYQHGYVVVSTENGSTYNREFIPIESWVIRAFDIAYDALDSKTAILESIGTPPGGKIFYQPNIILPAGVTKGYCTTEYISRIMREQGLIIDRFKFKKQESPDIHIAVDHDFIAPYEDILGRIEKVVIEHDSRERIVAKLERYRESLVC